MDNWVFYKRGDLESVLINLENVFSINIEIGDSGEVSVEFISNDGEKERLDFDSLSHFQLPFGQISGVGHYVYSLSRE